MLKFVQLVILFIQENNQEVLKLDVLINSTKNMVLKIS